jgi:hypothetical protein
VQSRFASRNKKQHSVSYTAASKPAKQQALPEQDVALESYSVSYEAYMAFITGPFNMLLVRAALDHAAETAKVSAHW